MKLNCELNNNFFIHEAQIGDVDYNFEDQSFDKITCVSVLEHIRNSGDSHLMSSIARLLKKGGSTVISFPFNNGDYIEEESPEGVGFFQRKYNIKEINARLVIPSSLIVKKVIYFGERFIKFGELYRQKRFEKISYLLPLFHSLFWRIVHSYEDSFRNFHEKEIDKKGVGVACIVLVKE